MAERGMWRWSPAWVMGTAALGLLTMASACRPMPPMGEEAKTAAPRDRAPLREVRYTDKTPEEWLALLGHRKAQVRDQAIDALVQYGPAQVPALRKLVRQSNHVNARVSALRALSVMKGAASTAVPDVMEAARAEEWDVRAAAVEALGTISQGNPHAVTALCAALRDEDAGVRAAAAKALRKSGAEGPQVLAALIAALDDSDANVQSAAAAALGRLGAKAKDALPALEKALQSAGPVAAVSIEEAVRNIRQAAPPP